MRGVSPLWTSAEIAEATGGTASGDFEVTGEMLRKPGVGLIGHLNLIQVPGHFLSVPGNERNSATLFQQLRSGLNIFLSYGQLG